VATLDARREDSPVDFPRLDDDVKGLVNYMTDDLREFKRQAQENATTSASGLLDAYSNVQTIRRELTNTFGTAKASWQEDILTATGPNSAIGQQLTQINVSLGTKADASTVVLLQSRVDGVQGDMTAISNALTEVNASVNDINANGSLRFTATSGSGGASSRIAALARVGIGDSWKQAGWFVNVTQTSSQFVVIANQFAIADPNTDGSFTYPFVVENGRVVMENIVVGTVKFKRLQSDNNKFDARGDGSNAYLRIIV
jgi:hypothetical protein